MTGRLSVFDSGFLLAERDWVFGQYSAPVRCHRAVALFACDALGPLTIPDCSLALAYINPEAEEICYIVLLSSSWFSHIFLEEGPDPATTATVSNASAVIEPPEARVHNAAPSIFHDIVDDEPPVLTVRIVVVGTTAFITFVVLAICFFLLAQRHTPRRRHVPGTRRQNTLRIRLPHILTDTMLAERAFVRSITAGALVVGSNQLAPVAAPPTARRSGHIRVYEGSTSSVSLLSSLESDVTDFSFNGAGLRA